MDRIATLNYTAVTGDNTILAKPADVFANLNARSPAKQAKAYILTSFACVQMTTSSVQLNLPGKLKIRYNSCKNRKKK